MIVINTGAGRKYWTEAYQEEGDFLVFQSQVRDGSIRQVKLNKSCVVEITDLGPNWKGEKSKKSA